MSVKTQNLTKNQARAITALLSNRTIEDAALAVGLNPRTIYRWMNEPGFTQALRAAEGEAISDAVRALVVDLRANHTTMRAVRDDLGNSAAVRLRAAQSLDNSLLRWRELLDIETRLADLEMAIYGKHK